MCTAGQRAYKARQHDRQAAARQQTKRRASQRSAAFSWGRGPCLGAQARSQMHLEAVLGYAQVEASSANGTCVVPMGVGNRRVVYETAGMGASAPRITALLESLRARCWRRSEPSCNPVQSARLIDHRGARVFLAFARQLSWASALCYTSNGAIGTFRVSTSLSIITLRSAIRFLLCLLADASGLLPSLSSA